MKMNQREGFTLIELLVVIAIIAVLMGILMPALSRARKQARSAACMSQLKSWGLIWSMYFDDYNGRLPDVEKGRLITSGGWHRGFWVSLLRPGWGKKPQILKCPGAKKVHPKRSSGQNQGDVNYTYDMPPFADVQDGLEASYAMNLFACSNTQSSLQGRKREYHWQNQLKVKRAGEVPLFLDAMWRGGGPHWDSSNAIIPPRKNGQWTGAGYEMQHFAMDRHGGGVNGLFMDNHVSKVRVKELWGLNWHKGYDRHRAYTQSDSWWGSWLSGM
ncbi:type II secretion system protein [Planctomycetota bacterium]